MQLGTFSISLNVKDIAKSRAFYEALGFSVVEGDQSQGWLVMKNGDANIGIFQGVIEKNTITFNPGWDNYGKNLDDFADYARSKNRSNLLALPLSGKLAKVKSRTISSSTIPTATPFFLTSTCQAKNNCKINL